MATFTAALAVLAFAATSPGTATGSGFPANSAATAEEQTAAERETPGDEIVVTAAPRSTAGDPLAKVNAQSFAATQAVDDAVIGPVAMTYKRTIPEPIRDGARNFFRNLREPMVAANDLLQLRPGRSMRTLARFAVNTTAGGAGLFDIAKRRPFRLARHPNSLADTLGFYGVGTGPYLFLPLVGPTTVRDLAAGGLDRLIMPFSIGGPLKQPAYTISAGAMSRLDRRARADGRLQAIRATDDPYAARRDAYLRDRQAEIDALHRHGGEATAAFAALDPVTAAR